MQLFPDVYKPIRYFGYVLCTLGLCGLYLFAYKIQGAHDYLASLVVLGLVSSFFLLLGIGLLRKNRLSFLVFKKILDYMSWSWTRRLHSQIAKATLEYIDKNHVERYLK